METTVEIQLRPAIPEDVKQNEKRLKPGVMFFLKSPRDHKFEGPYYTSDATDKTEFTSWFISGMVYVAKSPLDYEIKVIN